MLNIKLRMLFIVHPTTKMEFKNFCKFNYQGCGAVGIHQTG
jgi:hypothetical protein